MTPTRLPAVHDPSANGVVPIVAEVTLHNPEGREYLMRLTCGDTSDIVPAAERAVESLQMDLGVSDWRAA